MRSIEQLEHAMRTLAESEEFDIARHEDADALLLEAVKLLSEESGRPDIGERIAADYETAVGRTTNDAEADEIVTASKTEPLPLDPPDDDRA